MRVTHVLGWLFIAGGVVVLLYVLYALLFTGLATERAQADLRDDWQQHVTGDPEPTGDPSPVERRAPADSVALLEFVRPGADESPVHAEPLVVLGGVTGEDLVRGPGHYPETAGPGEDGNFAVAGHRTTHGAPFFHLDRLREGDEVHVTDTEGNRYVYAVKTQRVVSPADVWVIGPDPLDTGQAILTLTTCDPRFSNRERLVVHAELVSEPA